MLFVSMANATTFDNYQENRDCHAEGCQAVEDFEHMNGDLDEETAQFIYDSQYANCMEG